MSVEVLLTFREICLAFRCSIRKGQQLRRDGDWPPTVRIGGRDYCRPQAVTEWLAQRERTPPHAG